MNRHIFIDRLITWLGSLVGEGVRFFRNGTESQPLETLVGRISVISGQHSGSYQAGAEYPVTFETPMGRVETRYKVLTWNDALRSTLLFHHGSGDLPYDNRIGKILSGDDKPLPANVIALSAPFNTSKKEYIEAVGTLERFAHLVAVSARLFEHLVSELRDRSRERIVISGISLGGWIANLHHGMFNTASEYRPVFAGAAMDDLFFHSPYRNLTSRTARSEEETIRRVLNFEDLFLRSPRENVYPLLAVFDQYVRFDRQRSCYLPDHITTMEAGHITGSIRHRELKEFLARGFA